MAWLQNSVASVFVRRDERALETVVMKSVVSSSQNPIDDNDGIASRPSCNNNSSSTHSSSSRNRNRNHRDYKNERLKLTYLKTPKSARIDDYSDDSVDETFQMSRTRLRKSKNHDERVRGKLAETKDIKGDLDVKDSCQVEGSRDSSEVEETSDNVPESSSNNNNNNNKLSSFISPQQNRSVQSRRGSKSTIRSIATSSTTSTQKQSNSKTRYSFNDLVENSAWVDAGKQRSESSERRKRRTRRHSHQNPSKSGDKLFHPQHSNFFWINSPETSKDEMDDSYPLTSKRSSIPKSQLSRRRSDGDTNDVAASASATRSKLRRRTRHSMSDNLLPNALALNELVPQTSPHSSVRKIPVAPPPPPPLTPSKNIQNSLTTAHALDVGFVTPVLRDKKFKSAKSYSDRLMIAAESSKTPMATLRKILKDEKDLSMAENVRTSNGPDTTVPSGETNSPSLVPRIHKQMSQPTLKIPFFDDDVKDVVKINENRGDDEANNKEAKSPSRSQHMYKQMSQPLLNRCSSDDIAIRSENKGGYDVADNIEIKTPGRASRMFKQISQPLLKNPFSDSTIKNSEKRGDDEADTSRAAQVVQALGKSVAKSMKKQAKNTKRKIGKQISKMTPQPTTPKAHFALDDTTESLSPLFDGNTSNSSLLSQEDENDKQNDPPNSPLIGLKPPSGHCIRKECKVEEYSSADNVRQNNTSSRQLIGLKPVSGHSSSSQLIGLRPPSGHSATSQLSGLRPPSGHSVRKDSTSEDNESISSFFENDADNELQNSQIISPLAPLKPPSGQYTSECTSNKSEGLVQHTNLCVPPPPLTPVIEINDNKKIERILVSNDQKQGNEKRSRKKTRSKINPKNRQKKNESKPKKIDNEQMKYSMEKASIDGDPSSRTSEHGSSSRQSSSRGSAIIVGTSDPHLGFDNNEEEDSSIETTYEMNTDSNQNENCMQELRHLVDNSDLTIKDNIKECSQKHPYEISRADCSAQECDDTQKNCSITEAKTHRQSQPVASKELNASCHRSVNSTISTFVSSVPTSPSRTQSKNNSETSYSNQNKNDSNQLEPNSNTSIENGLNQPLEEKNDSELMAIAIAIAIEEETNKIDKNKITTSISVTPYREDEIPIEAENTNNLTLDPLLKEEVPNTLETEVALNEDVSAEKNQDKPNRPTTVLENVTTASEATRTKEVRKDQGRPDDDLSTELFNLLKKENVKKKIGSKDKKDVTRERTHRHKKDMRRMRRKLQVIDMDITVDSDALDVSEITTILNPPDRLQSAKPTRTSMNDSGFKGGQVNSHSATKSRKIRSCSTSEISSPKCGQHSPHATKIRKTRSRSTSERDPSSRRQIPSSGADKNRKTRSRSTSKKDPSSGQIHSPSVVEKRKTRSRSTSKKDPSSGQIHSPSVVEKRKTRSRSNSERNPSGGQIHSPSVADKRKTRSRSTSERDARGRYIHPPSVAEKRKTRSRSTSDRESGGGQIDLPKDTKYRQARSRSTNGRYPRGGQLQSSTVAKDRKLKSRSRSESGSRGGHDRSPDVTKNRMRRRRSPRGGLDQSPNRIRGRKTRSIRRSSVVKSRNEQDKSRAGISTASTEQFGDSSAKKFNDFIGIGEKITSQG